MFILKELTLFVNDISKGYIGFGFLHSSHINPFALHKWQLLTWFNAKSTDFFSVGIKLPKATWVRSWNANILETCFHSPIMEPIKLSSKTKQIVRQNYWWVFQARLKVNWSTNVKLVIFYLERIELLCVLEFIFYFCTYFAFKCCSKYFFIFYIYLLLLLFWFIQNQSSYKKMTEQYKERKR